MVLCRVIAVAGLVACGAFGSMSPSSAKPAVNCSAVDGVDGPVGDIQFDLQHLGIVMNNAYALVDTKKRDEEFRLHNIYNANGHLRDAVHAVGDPHLDELFETVRADYPNLDQAIHDQFVLVQDQHYDIYSSTPYETPRLTGGDPTPEAWDAIGRMNDDAQAVAEALDALRDQNGCPAPGDGTGSDETGPDGAEPQCRFHPGSFHCDATGSIEH
jgi:hypothetical protein